MHRLHNDTEELLLSFLGVIMMARIVSGSIFSRYIQVTCCLGLASEFSSEEVGTGVQLT